LTEFVVLVYIHIHLLYDDLLEVETSRTDINDKLLLITDRATCLIKWCVISLFARSVLIKKSLCCATYLTRT